MAARETSLRLGVRKWNCISIHLAVGSVRVSLNERMTALSPSNESILLTQQIVQDSRQTSCVANFVIASDEAPLSVKEHVLRKSGDLVAR